MAFVHWGKGISQPGLQLHPGSGSLAAQPELSPMMETLSWVLPTYLCTPTSITTHGRHCLWVSHSYSHF